MRPLGGIDSDRVARGEGFVESLIETVFGRLGGRRRVWLRLGHVVRVPRLFCGPMRRTKPQNVTKMLEIWAL
jgi:hypothetical protein